MIKITIQYTDKTGEVFTAFTARLAKDALYFRSFDEMVLNVERTQNRGYQIELDLMDSAEQGYPYDELEIDSVWIDGVLAWDREAVSCH